MIIDVVKLASKNRMTLSKHVREMLNLEIGDVLAFVDLDDHVGIIKLNEENILKDLKYYNTINPAAEENK
jgi:bifunctional DNA-binding transcriptional regulator/antitoxin component of YhaV-PrlF toxin-antitoxin module